MPSSNGSFGIPSIASEGIQEIAVTDDSTRMPSPSLDAPTVENRDPEWKYPACEPRQTVIVDLSRRSPIAYTVRPVQYFYVNVRDELGAAYRVLSVLAERGVSLLAFTAVPTGPSLAQFALFPEDPNTLVAEARVAQLPLEGPHHALLVQGDDELGALASVHERLFRAGVDIYASTGVTDAKRSFGYVIYVREDQFERAVSALEL
jgi:hypothetical protein